VSKTHENGSRECGPGGTEEGSLLLGLGDTWGRGGWRGAERSCCDATARQQRVGLDRQGGGEESRGWAEGGGARVDHGEWDGPGTDDMCAHLHAIEWGMRGEKVM
jgi:hypothetical protein